MPDFEDFVMSLGDDAERDERTLALLRAYHSWLVPELRRSALQASVCALGTVAEQWSMEEGTL